MKALTAFSFGLALVAQANADRLYGVQLVYANQHSSTTGGGSVASAVGVEDGGLGVGQIYNYARSGYFVGGDGSSASDYWDVAIDAFWLGSSPPPTLYLNQGFGGSVTWVANVEIQSAFATASSGGSFASYSSSGNATAYTSTNNGGLAHFWRATTGKSVTWIQITTINGEPLYKTVSAITFTTPTVSATGSTYMSGNNPATSYARGWGLSSVGLGISHRIWVDPIP